MAKYLEEMVKILGSFKESVVAIATKVNDDIDKDLGIIQDAYKRVVDNGKVAQSLSGLLVDFASEIEEVADDLDEQNNIVYDFRYSVKDSVEFGYLEDEELESELFDDEDDDCIEEDFVVDPNEEDNEDSEE